MPNYSDPDHISADWFERQDTERAVHSSTRLFSWIYEERVDPVKSLDAMEAGVEPQFDGVGGKPSRVLNALRVAAPAFRHAEPGLDTPELIRMRCRPQIMEARAYHVAGEALLALVRSYATLVYVVELADGYAALGDIMSRPSPNAIAENAVGALGIFMASLGAAMRSRHITVEAAERLIGRCRGLLSAYLLGARGDLVDYARTDALAAQGFYLFKRLGRPEDAPLIEALYFLDIATRKKHARAQATCPLRDMTWAEFLGDAAAAREHGQQALDNLRHFPLPRHLHQVGVRGIIAA
jgi:hypothetical protein